MDRIRSKTGAPDAEDFRDSEGTPLVVDTTAVTGRLYFVDDAGTIREVGDRLTICTVSALTATTASVSALTAKTASVSALSSQTTTVSGTASISTLAVSGDSTLGDSTSDTAKVAGNLVLPKDGGYGIKVDTSSAGFPWHDMIGNVSIRGIGGKDPAYNVYRGGIRGYQFSVNDEVFIEFHIPHDYAPGTDLYLHFHWSNKDSRVTGGTVTWGAEVSYAKGHDQAAFSSPITATVVGTASDTQYQHIITEFQLSAASPSATQLDSDIIEVDGLILMRAYLSANNLTGFADEPFLHFVDIHYQSTNIGTKQKAPPFWT